MNYKNLEKKYKALANRRRLEIIHYLTKESKANVGQIAEQIKLSFNATSKHLNVLKNNEFIESEQVGLEQYYFIINKNDVFIKHILSIL
ncbi:metalloregulator ArsR/SmtB family transcription factor [Patescibacteria group bacterium]|nr:metalloregulator ArsR/SmtB family transcription factor [Patescibacteria group bacterium]MBU4057407.1 metalloregulator ArsR/SmtB family transcription factor [Patescibacteria group bacterium]MBU4115543.1 metalloregulator ArsR/SmtB family transcription factor [Patescibacteria group bacterium]